MGSDDEAELVARLRARDPASFRTLVGRYHPTMVRVATTYVRSPAVAEEVAQDTWVAVLKGIDRFEGRSSLRTWIFHILMNQARTRGVRERRVVPFASLEEELGEGRPSVPPGRFTGPPGRGAWSRPPTHWSDVPEEQASVSATLEALGETVRALPENQRRVVVLRDLEGWSSKEVCELLDISEVNQRVLLHRGRTRLRAELARDIGGEP